MSASDNSCNSSNKNIDVDFNELCDFIEKVKTFQYVAGQPVDLTGLPENTAKLLSFRQSCVLEEIQEYLDSQNRVEALDALVDITYFIAGFYATFKGSQNWTRDAGYETPSFGLFKKTLEHLKCERSFDSLEEAASIFRHLYHYVKNVVSECNFDKFREAFDRVHENNMSKFLRDPEEANREVLLNPSLTIRETEYQGQKYYVLLNEIGKVQKPSTFKPVILDDLA